MNRADPRIANPSARMPDAYVGRQVVLARSGNTWAYELLNAAEKPLRSIPPPDSEGAVGVLNAVIDLGVKHLAGSSMVIVPLPRRLLVDYSAALIPSERVVLLVEGASAPDIQSLAALRFLKQRGFQAALEVTPAACSTLGDLRAWLELADYVRLPASGLPSHTLRETVAVLRRHGAPLIARDVGDHEDYARCRNVGFSYFQGPFLGVPHVVQGYRTPTSQQALLDLLSQLQDPDVALSTVEQAVSRDITLSYRLLRYLNSAALALPRRIESIHHALVMLGLETLKRWVSLLALSALSNKPQAIVEMALVRARMCQRLGEVSGYPKPESLFLCGLFSLLDALLDRPMPELLRELNLPTALTRAILHGEGEAGRILQTVTAYEAGDWANVAHGDLTAGQLATLWVEVVGWAGDTAVQLAA